MFVETVGGNSQSKMLLETVVVICQRKLLVQTTSIN